MVIVEVTNIYSKLIGGSAKLIRSVDSALAVPVPGAEFSNSYRQGFWDGNHRFFKVATKKFPSGLLHEVINIILKNGEEYKISDLRNIPEGDIQIPEQIDLLDESGTITLREYQQVATEQALDAMRGIINIATNGGKTEIACAIIKCLLPILPEGMTINFFTHSQEILTQSHKRISKRLGIKVGRIQGGKKWDLQQVNVIMVPSICSYLKKPKDLKAHPKLTKLREDVEKLSDRHYLDPHLHAAREILKQYEKEKWVAVNEHVEDVREILKSTFCFIGDEAHHSSASTWYDTFMALENAVYRFGMTGTVDESDPINLMKLYGCTGPIVSKVSNKFLIEGGYSAQVTVYMMPVPCNVLEGKSYEEVRPIGIIHNSIRNDVISNMVLDRANLGKQCLIIVNETEHGEILLDLLRDNGHTVELSHGECTSKFRELTLDIMRSGDLRILIATSILDEGVDISGINCLFLAGGGKSLRMLLQRIGRGLRKKDDGSDLEVYDTLDLFNDYLVEHTMSRYEVYKAEGFPVKKLK